MIKNRKQIDQADEGVEERRQNWHALDPLSTKEDLLNEGKTIM